MTNKTPDYELELLQRSVELAERKLAKVDRDIERNAAELRVLLSDRGVAKHDLKVFKAQLAKYHKRPDKFK